MERTIHFTTILLAAASLLFSACSDEDAKGKVQLYITDAPIDAENVTGVYLTIKGVELKGSDGWQTVATYEEPIKINILDYQNGSAYFLTEEVLSAGTYTEARLQLDAPAEQGGSRSNPGCYLTYTDGSTEPLFIPSGAQSGYKVKGEFNLAEGGTVAVTLDFDVRKSVVEAGASGKMLLKPVVRLIANQDAALIKGTYTDLTEGQRVVVYAYEKGTFTTAEMDADEDGVRFVNAITSTQVSETGTFTLAFMTSGEYDLIFVSVSDTGEPTTLLGSFPAEVTSGSILTINVSAELLIAL